MSAREELVELIRKGIGLIRVYDVIQINLGNAEEIADRLIANGVTVQKPINTNADRIRSMSDEELAYYLASLMIDVRKGVAYSTNEDRWFNWLQHPTEECE